MTSDTLPNPWDTLPSGSYWATEVQEVQPLYRWHQDNDGTVAKFKTYSNGSFLFRRAYLDTDQMSATGFSIGTLGADFLIDNGNLYSYSGGGTAPWTFLKTINQTSSSGAITWSVALADIGMPVAIATLYELRLMDGTSRYSLVDTRNNSESTNNIIDYFAENDSNRIYYQATFVSDYAFKHVFIDTDSSEATGYQADTIGSEFFIENETLYKYTGDGTSWSWDFAANANGVVDPNGVVRWSIPRWVTGDTKSSGESQRLVFHGSGSADPDYASPPYVYGLSQ